MVRHDHVWKPPHAWRRWHRFYWLLCGILAVAWLALRSGRLLVFGMRGHVLASDDAGETWTALPRVSKHSLGGGAELIGGEGVVALDTRGTGTVVNDDACPSSTSYWAANAAEWRASSGAATASASTSRAIALPARRKAGS